MNRTDKGFAVIETILILIVIAIVAFIGWYVWHARQNTNKTLSQTNATSEQNSTTAQALSGKDCTTTDPTMKGKVFTAPGNAYSLCLPDGWTLGLNDGTVTGATMTYQAGVLPKIDLKSKGEGVQALGIDVGKSTDTNYQAGYDLKTDKVGTVKAVDMTGTEYKQNVASENTLKYTFHFVKGSKSIVVEYQVSSDSTDQSSALISVLQTLALN